MSVDAMSAVFKATVPLTPTETLVLLSIADRASGEGFCIPSHRDTAERTNLSRRTVIATMKALEDRGIIKRTPRRRADGSASSSETWLDVDSLRSETAAPGGVQQSAFGGESLAPQEPRSNHQKEPDAQERETDLFGEEAETTPPAPSNEPPPGAFELFWREYPRKTAIGAARASFAKAWPKIPMPKLDPRSPVQPAPGFEKCVTLMRAIDAQKAGWTDPKFIPHASTWLNQERWADEVGSAPSNRPTGVDDWQ